MQIETLITKLSRFFIGSALFVATFCGAEEEQQPERVPVGTRASSHVDWVKAQEIRCQLIQKCENGEELSEEERNNLSETDQQAGEESLADPQTEEIAAKGLKTSSEYYTTHQGAFHHPKVVSLLGEKVELEDGSIWSVYLDDRYKTLDWMTGDVVIILPNNSLFSSYRYRLVNLNTSASVKVNLTLGPIYNGLFSHWIVAINHLYHEICLEDGTIWKISSLDDTILNKWLPNDTVIIGINSGWFSSVNPNILINVNTNNFVIGGCVN